MFAYIRQRKSIVQCSYFLFDLLKRFIFLTVSFLSALSSIKYLFDKKKMFFYELIYKLLPKGEFYVPS